MAGSRSIKTKDSVLSIKTFDHRTNLKHYIKNTSIRCRQAEEKNDRTDEQNNEVYSATETVQNVWKKTAVSSVRHLRRDRKILKRSSLRAKTGDKEEERTLRFDHKRISPAKPVYQKSMLQNVTNDYVKISLRNRPQSFSFLIYINDLHVSGISFLRRVGNKLSGSVYSASGIFAVVLLTMFFGVFSVFANTTVVAEGVEIPEASVQPDFTNEDAWGYNNPYTRAGYIGQCTWFAWGRFYEIYGYDPGFRGDGWNCAAQLVAAHPDKFELSYAPSAGAVFSAIGRNHVGIVISVDENEITIQEGNLDGRSNLFVEAITDWREITYPIWKFIAINGGVVYSTPINKEK